MQSTVKTILIWVLILVVAIGLYNLVEPRSSNERYLDLTAFLGKVQEGQVSKVEISGSRVTGRLKTNERFESTIPEGHSAIFDRLTAAGVQVTVLPEDRSSWFGVSVAGLPAFLIMAGLILWVAISAVVLVLVLDLSRFVKRELARSGGNHSPA
jgi:ATP-dependent Zn protease